MTSVPSAPSAVSPSPTPQTVLLLGGAGIPAQYTLPGLQGEACVASGEFFDVQEGAQARVLGPADEVVALLELGPAQLGDDGACYWLFTGQVEAGLGFYSVSVLDWQSEVYAEDDLTAVILDLQPR